MRVDRVAQFLRRLARRLREILARARVENRARRADHEAGAGGASCPPPSPLRRRRPARRRPAPGTADRPRACGCRRAPRDTSRRPPACNCRPLFHSFATVSATCWNSFLPGPTLRSWKSLAPGFDVRHRMITPLSRVLEKRLHRIAAEIRIHRHRIGAVALEGFLRVLLGGAADVAALAVEDHDGIRAASS